MTLPPPPVAIGALTAVAPGELELAFHYLTHAARRALSVLRPVIAALLLPTDLPDAASVAPAIAALVTVERTLRETAAVYREGTALSTVLDPATRAEVLAALGESVSNPPVPHTLDATPAELEIALRVLVHEVGNALTALKPLVDILHRNPAYLARLSATQRVASARIALDRLVDTEQVLDQINDLRPRLQAVPLTGIIAAVADDVRAAAAARACTLATASPAGAHPAVSGVSGIASPAGAHPAAASPAVSGIPGVSGTASPAGAHPAAASPAVSGIPGVSGIASPATAGTHAPPDLFAHADPLWLRHSLRNLADNAVRAAPRGGTVTLTGALRDPTHVTLAVHNTGPGLTQDELDYIFHADLATRAGLRRPLAPQGAGIGLSLVRFWMHAMGGTIEAVSAQSADARGTTVTLTLRGHPARHGGTL